MFIFVGRRGRLFRVVEDVDPYVGLIFHCGLGRRGRCLWVVEDVDPYGDGNVVC